MSAYEVCPDHVRYLVDLGLLLGVGGIVVLLLELKLAKGFAKFIFIFAALALIAGAACWHFYKQ